MILDEMQRNIRDKLNDMRALDRIVNSIEFAQCLKLDSNNTYLNQAISEGNLSFVREWMEDTFNKELCETSIRQLRLLAGQYGIKGYVAMTKDELLVAIVQVQNELKQTKNSIISMPHSTDRLKAVSR